MKTAKSAMEWARKEYESLLECPQCGDIVNDGQEKWCAGYITPGGAFVPDEDYCFCSEGCAEKNYTYEEEDVCQTK